MSEEPTPKKYGDLALYRRRGPDDAPRLLVVGDSVSRTIGYGLERWGTETGAAVVWSAERSGPELFTGSIKIPPEP